jgi:hypothetical protein
VSAASLVAFAYFALFHRVPAARAPAIAPAASPTAASVNVAVTF